MAEPVKTTIRLTDQDQANIDRIIKTGIATNISEAIRVGLTVGPQFLTLWQALIAAKVDDISDALTQLQEDLRREREQAAPDFSKIFMADLDELRQASPTGEIPAWIQKYIDRTAENRQAMYDAIVAPSGRSPKR
jgi:Arc/MetJ-type ribon-helix-helix transcriptional regulator